MDSISKVKYLIKSKIKEGYVPYIMGSYDNISTVDTKPFGLLLKKIIIEDSRNRDFFDTYIDMNGLAFGKKSLGIPRWVAIDCVSLPSVTVGFAMQAKKIPIKLKKELGLNNPNQLVPVSEYTLLPKINQKDKFINCTLCSVIEKQGLASLSALLGIAIYRPKEIDIVAQFADVSLKTHSKYGDLEIIIPNLDIHNISTSFVGRLRIKNLEEVCNNFLKKRTEHRSKNTFKFYNYDIETKCMMIKNSKKKIAKYCITYPGIVSEGNINSLATLIVEKVM
jgi:hypothetical protein